MNVGEDVELAWKKEIAKRVDDVESGAVKCISWKDVRKKLKQNFHASN